LLNKNDYKSKKLEYTHHLEVFIEELTRKIEKLEKGVPSSRFYAIKAIENNSLLPKHIYSSIVDLSREMSKENSQMHRLEPFETVSYERHHLAMKLSEEVSTYTERKKRHWLEKVDDVLLSPILGYFTLFFFFLLYFLTIFIVGNFISSLIEPPLTYIGSTFDSLKNTRPFLWYTLNGAYRGVYGILGIVLPYFFPLIFLTSIFEDTGYLSRVAFLLDSLMHKIGLHGKSVVPFILGFGCSVPAMYATRTIENKRDRMVTGLLIPFIPCSARITVIFVFTAAFTGPFWAFIIFVFVLFVIAINGKLLTRFLSQPIGLIIEIPRLKLPTVSNSFSKTWMRLREFLKEAFIFLLLGSIILGWIEYFDIVKYVDLIFAPLVNGIMGLPDQLGSTLIFGFFRKELILVMMTQSLGVNTITELGSMISISQIVIFIIFVTLYFPCFTTFVVILKEFGWKVVALSSILSIFVATLSAFLFRLLFLIF
jgi:ferrous iron transport protein B